MAHNLARLSDRTGYDPVTISHRDLQSDLQADKHKWFILLTLSHSATLNNATGCKDDHPAVDGLKV